MSAYSRRFLVDPTDAPPPEPEILVDLGKGDDRTEEAPVDNSVDDADKEDS